MALIMLVMHDFDLFALVFFQKGCHFICYAAVAIYQKSFVAFPEGNSSPGKIIKINSAVFAVMPVPDFKMAFRINKKISVAFRIIKTAAMKKKFSVHIEKKPDFLIRTIFHPYSPFLRDSLLNHIPFSSFLQEEFIPFKKSKPALKKSGAGLCFQRIIGKTGVFIPKSFLFSDSVEFSVDFKKFLFCKGDVRHSEHA